MIKLYKVIALFGVSWFVFKMVSFFLLTPFTNSELVSDMVLYAAIALVGYYVYLKIATKPVERIVFDYNNRVVSIFYKHYFLHVASTKTFSLDALSSALLKKQSFFQGTYLELSIFHRNRIIAFIGNGASDWQRLPNFIQRIHERITEVTPNGTDLITPLNSH